MISKLLTHTLLTTPLLLGLTTASAFAQPDGTPFDPAQLPATRGVVSQYDLSPRGDVDGLILTDGTEVHIAPNLGPQLVQSVKPGDSVIIHGLRARVIPLVQAMSVTDGKTGTMVADTMAAAPPPPAPPVPPSGQGTQVHGTVKMQLHGPRGELNGVLLADGTFVHLPPLEATRLAHLLTAGTAIASTGQEMSSAQGRMIVATAIGPEGGTLQAVTLALPAPVGGNPGAEPPAPLPGPNAMNPLPAPPPGPSAMNPPPVPMPQASTTQPGAAPAAP